MNRILGFIADKLINTFAPVVAQRSFEQMQTGDWLADVEADHDSWEPDEIWAAHLRFTDPAKPPLAGVSVTPAAAVDCSASSGGGHLPIHDELIEELVQEYRQKLYDWFRP